VSDEATFIPGFGTFSSIDIKSGGTFGASFGVVASNGGEVGFTWSHQSSHASLSGPADDGFGAMTIDSYHGYIGYNFIRRKTRKPDRFWRDGLRLRRLHGFAGQPGSVNGPSRFGANISAASSSS
jgi:hypothetical protein